MPATGWLNDPNGLCQRDGTHHLFYQYNPGGGFHDRIQWGHATSSDLVHWTDQPVALRPGDGPDADGCWSGVLVDDGGIPTLVYSGRAAGVELPCLATGSADLLTWTKDPANPVISEPPRSGLSGFRDHCVWREGDRWRMLIGAGVSEVGGFAALYESADLRSWTYRGPMLSGSAYNRAQDDATWTGTMWECAELFRLAGGKDVPLDGTRPGNDYLVFSAWHEGVTKHALYWSGRYRGDQFAPSGLHPLDLGGRYFYAPQSYRDESGRRVMFGWMQDALSVVRTVGAGWAGVMSLPRLVTEADDGRLRLNPVPEVALLRGESIADSTEPIDPGIPHLYPGVTGDQFDLEVCTVLEPGAGLKLRLPGSELGAGYVGAASVRIVRTGPGVLSVQLDHQRGRDQDRPAGRIRPGRRTRPGRRPHHRRPFGVRDVRQRCRAERSGASGDHHDAFGRGLHRQLSDRDRPGLDDERCLGARTAVIVNRAARCPLPIDAFLLDGAGRREPGSQPAENGEPVLPAAHRP